MAKKKNTKHIPLLSPENYIRQKSRNLPIVKCYVNDDWEDEYSRLANIAIIRQHANGNQTACMYMVDLFCLGAKDTVYFFNLPPYEMEERLETIFDELDMKAISYDLAHNIIYAAIEFADEYGLKPHKDFTKTTQFFLEEDNDNIPLIEIECGRAGKPFYINNGYENAAQERQILKQLEKTAGEGNFYFSNNEEDENWDENNAGIDIFKKEVTSFNELSLAEKKDRFLKIMTEMNEDSSFEKYKDLVSLTEALAPDFIDSNKRDLILTEIENDLHWGEIVDMFELPNSFFKEITDEKAYLVELIEQYEDLDEDDLKEAKRMLKIFENEAKELPAAGYFYLLSLMDKKRKFGKQLDKYLELFSDYPLFKMQKMQHVMDEMPQEKLKILFEELKHVFDGRGHITDIEADYFTAIYLTFTIVSNRENLDLETLVATSDYITKNGFVDAEKSMEFLLILNGYKQQFLFKLLTDDGRN